MKKKIRFKIAPALLLLAVGWILTDRSGMIGAILLASAFHEAGHLLAAKCMKIPMDSFCLDLLGARLDAYGRMLSYKEEWLLAAAGPLFSFLLPLFCAFLPKSTFLQTLNGVSVLLGILNLLPIRTFDGGRMLSSFLSEKFSEKVSERILSVFSFFFLFILWGISVYCLLRIGDGISLFSFSISLLSRIFEANED